MAISAFTNGKRKYSHSVAVGGSELILYFSVEMDKKDIDNFADILELKGKATGFYACVVVNEKTNPKTFISYKDVNDNVRELFDISTGISPVSILTGHFMGGGTK